jgi:predicted phosphodiesterase
VRTAIVADIHGNLTALEAVIADLEGRAPDVVLHGGDLALAGGQPAEVVDRVRELGWPGVVGNTDEALWRPELHSDQLRRAPKLAALLHVIFEECAPATRELLGEERTAWLRELPGELRTDELALVHAAPGELWRAPMPDAADEELAATYAPLQAPLAAYGHIHQGYVRTVGPFSVANTGSVGMPWDGDPRASYLLLEDGEARIVRVEYDIERETAVLAAGGYPDAERLIAMRRSGSYVAP